MINQGEYTNLDLQELLKKMNNMEKSIRTINKNSKKTIMSIDLLKEEIEDNKKQNFKLKKELDTKARRRDQKRLSFYTNGLDYEKLYY